MGMSRQHEAQAVLHDQNSRPWVTQPLGCMRQAHPAFPAW